MSIVETMTDKGTIPNETFDFLGYTFRPRRSKNRWGRYFVNFSPGVSNAAAKAIRQTIRGWRLDCRVDDLARMFNPILRGWITYYGR
ncbi:MAG: group II intron maturase-specific domain-containing protein [Gammaproteobacteria bacterium]